MTWGGGKPHPVGDQGQRYEVSFSENGTRKVMGWTPTIEGARRFCASITLHPVWTEPQIWDREQQAMVPVDDGGKKGFFS